MKIKPYAVLGLATVCAGASLATIVLTNDPVTAEPLVIRLFWLSLILTLWGLVATVSSWAGQRLAIALCNGLFWATGLVSIGLLSRQGIANKRLFLGIIIGTILLSVALWFRSRRRISP